MDITFSIGLMNNMFQNRILTLQVITHFRDMDSMSTRIAKIIKNSNCSSEEQTLFMNKLHLEFHAPVANMLAKLYAAHPDLVPLDEGHPPGFFEKRIEHS